jgi:hypothetical protein
MGRDHRFKLSGLIFFILLFSITLSTKEGLDLLKRLCRKPKSTEVKSDRKI